MENNNIRTILVDDEMKSLEILEQLLGRYEEIKITNKIHDPNEVLKAVIHNKPHVLFLDIKMPEKDGFEIVEDLEALRKLPKIVFVTSHNQYALQAIKHSAFDYLLKPVVPEELDETIVKVKREIADVNPYEEGTPFKDSPLCPEKIKFHTRNGIIFFEYQDIIFAEADSSYTIMHLKDNHQEIISQNLKSIEEKLPSPPFFRVSRSYIININYLTKILKKENICELQKDEMTFSLKISQNKIKMLNEII